MKLNPKLGFVFIGCAMFVTANAQATTVVQVPLTQLLTDADACVHGVVRAVNEELTAEEGGPFRTAIEVEVVEVFSGLSAQTRTLRLVVPGGRKGELTMAIPGMPRFAAGNEVIFVLEKAAHGFVFSGLSQGVFRIDRTGPEPIAIRDFDGIHLVDFSGNGVVMPAARQRLVPLLQTLRGMQGVRP